MFTLCFFLANRLRMCYSSYLVILLLPGVLSTYFSFSDIDRETHRSICDIKLGVEFSAKLTATNHTGEIVSVRNLTTKDVQRVSGDCKHYGNTIDLITPPTIFRFTFVSEQFTMESPVMLYLQVLMKAHSTFYDVKIGDGYVCFNGPAKNLGSRQFSYLCEVPERIPFTPVKCDSGHKPLTDESYSYSVEFSLESIHAQAFDITRHQFSEHITCGETSGSYIGIIAGCIAAAVTLTAVVVVVVAHVIRRRRRYTEMDS